MAMIEIIKSITIETFVTVLFIIKVVELVDLLFQNILIPYCKGLFGIK